MGTEPRKCSDCGGPLHKQTKPYHCKPCAAKRMKAWRAANRERYLEMQRKRHEAWRRSKGIPARAPRKPRPEARITQGPRRVRPATKAVAVYIPSQNTYEEPTMIRVPREPDPIGNFNMRTTSEDAAWLKARANMRSCGYPGCPSVVTGRYCAAHREEEFAA